MTGETVTGETVTGTVVRSQQEIWDRVAGLDLEQDFFAARTSTLIHFLHFDRAKQFLREGVTAQQWTPDTDPLAVARDYLEFAIGKAINHRGISAARSIDHFTEWAWLSGDEKFTAALEQRYPYYGAPILRAVAVAIGATDSWAAQLTPKLRRMAAGQPCSPHCQGCVP